MHALAPAPAHRAPPLAPSIKGLTFPLPARGRAERAPDDSAPPAPLTFFDKTTPDERREIDQAILDSEPRTCKAVFAQFGLAAKGVSRSAFYNYAHKVRAAAAAAILAELPAVNAAEIAGKMMKLIGAHLGELALSEAPSSPAALHRMAQTLKILAAAQRAGAKKVAPKAGRRPSVKSAREPEKALE